MFIPCIYMNKQSFTCREGIRDSYLANQKLAHARRDFPVVARPNETVWESKQA